MRVRHTSTTRAIAIAGLMMTVALLGRPAAGTKEATAGAGEPAAKRILIVTGHDVPAHDWRSTTDSTRTILESQKGWVVRVSEEVGVLESTAIHSYDVIVLNYRNRPTEPLSEAGQANLARFVAEGKGLVALHFAVSAWGEWKEFRKMLGRVWVGRRKGGESRHAPRGPFQVRMKPHPIRGLADFEADDELYAGLAGDEPIEVLAVSRSPQSKQDEPIAWTVGYQKGRVFVLTLGHDVRSRELQGFRQLLIGGCRWAAD